MQQTDYRPRDAALVMAGGATIFLGSAWVALSPSLSSADPVGDFRQAVLIGLALTVVGVALMAAGLVRATYQLPSEELPSTGFWGAAAAVGTIALLLGTRIPLGWMTHFPPSDPRSQLTHVIGAILFFGSFASVFAVVATVMFVFRFVRRRSVSGDIPER